MQCAIEEFPTSFIESSDMARIDEIEARLEKRISRAIVGAWAVVIILLGWLGVGTGYLMSIRGDVQAIKQSMADHGLGQIVSDLESPKSPEKLQAALSTVIAQVQTARVNNQKPDAKKVAALSSALSQVVERNPLSPEGWQASAQLISFRSNHLQTADHLPCGTASPERIVVTGGPAAADTVATVEFSDCTLDLDKPDIWTESKSTPHIETMGGDIVQNWHLQLHNVIVHYSGGPLTHVSQAIFDHCTFDLQIYSQPPPLGQQLTETLLTASDIDHVNFAAIT